MWTSSSNRDPADKYTVRVDDPRPRCAATKIGNPAPKGTARALRPKDIQSRIRAGASVAQIAESAGMEISKVERFAHPRAAGAFPPQSWPPPPIPSCPTGRQVTTLLESITSRLGGRGLSAESTNWDAWRNDDGRWTVQVGWRAACPTTSHTSVSAPAHTAAPSPHRRLRANSSTPPSVRSFARSRRWRSWSSRTRRGPKLRFRLPHRPPQPEPMFPSPRLCFLSLFRPSADPPRRTPRAGQTQQAQREARRSRLKDVLLGVRSSGESADQRLAAQASSPIQPTATPTRGAQHEPPSDRDAPPSPERGCQPADRDDSAPLR